jgi:hypothetical protein
MKGLSGRLLALDAQRCTEHAFLSAADRCHCLAEYLPGRGYRAGEVNQLIVNLKCAPSIAAIDPRRRHFKQRAINNIASALRTRRRPSAGRAHHLDPDSDLASGWRCEL